MYKRILYYTVCNLHIAATLVAIFTDAIYTGRINRDVISVAETCRRCTMFIRYLVTLDASSPSCFMQIRRKWVRQHTTVFVSYLLG